MNPTRFVLALLFTVMAMAQVLPDRDVQITLAPGQGLMEAVESVGYNARLYTELRKGTATGEKVGKDEVRSFHPGDQLWLIKGTKINQVRLAEYLAAENAMFGEVEILSSTATTKKVVAVVVAPAPTPKTSPAKVVAKTTPTPAPKATPTPVVAKVVTPAPTPVKVIPTVPVPAKVVAKQAPLEIPPATEKKLAVATKDQVNQDPSGITMLVGKVVDEAPQVASAPAPAPSQTTEEEPAKQESQRRAEMKPYFLRFITLMVFLAVFLLTCIALLSYPVWIDRQMKSIRKAIHRRRIRTEKPPQIVKAVPEVHEPIGPISPRKLSIVPRPLSEDIKQIAERAERRESSGM